MAQDTTIAIVGAGLMGHGIAQVFAVAGHEVRVFDPSSEALAELGGRIRANLRSVGLNEDAACRVTPSPLLADAVADAAVVIEAAPEKLELKRSIFAEIESHAAPDAILASNTSVIPINAIMRDLCHPGRALGTHWWNPPFLVPLVEVIPTSDTLLGVASRMTALLAAVGKTPVLVNRDVPGFVGNRLQHALWREAIALVQEGVCDAETVDTVVKASFGRRLAVLGPIENADLVGLDLTLDIHETVLPALDRTPGPAQLLKDKVAGGSLGMKSGEGFRKWTPEEAARLRDRVVEHLKKLANA